MNKLLPFLFLIGITQNAFALCVISDIANLRDKPSSRSKVTLTVGKFTPLVRLGSSKGWYRVSDQDGQDHWVFRNLVSGKTKCLSISKRSARLHSGPNFESEPGAYGRADKYSPFKRLSKKGSWYKVRDASGNTAWVHESDAWIPRRVMKIGF